MLIREQVRKARQDAEARGLSEADEVVRELKREEGEKIKLNFGGKPATQKMDSPSASLAGADAQNKSSEDRVGEEETTGVVAEDGPRKENAAETAPAKIASPPPKIALKMGFQNKPKNVFVVAKKNALGGKKTAAIEQPKKMSEAERIMKEEVERKRAREASGAPHSKRQKF